MRRAPIASPKQFLARHVSVLSTLTTLSSHRHSLRPGKNLIRDMHGAQRAACRSAAATRCTGLTHNGTNLRDAWDGINAMFEDRVLPYLVRVANRITAAASKSAEVTFVPASPSAQAAVQQWALSVSARVRVGPAPPPAPQEAARLHTAQYPAPPRPAESGGAAMGGRLYPDV